MREQRQMWEMLPLATHWVYRVARAEGAPPFVIAHRGASGQAPENTMAAFELAIELGADIIELDVRRSSDGALVVIHDATVNRTTTGDFRGAVADLTLAELKSLSKPAAPLPKYTRPMSRVSIAASVKACAAAAAAICSA